LTTVNIQCELTRWTIKSYVRYTRTLPDTCLVKNLPLKADTPVDEFTVQGVLFETDTSREYFKTNDSIDGFKVEYHELKYFPKNLSKIFANLEAIYLNRGTLREIHSDDLKDFSRLVFLDLYQNEIEVLEMGLFQSNPSLEAIFLSRNRIKTVQSTAFSTGLNLRSLMMDYNPCFSGSAKNNVTAVSALISRMRLSCRGTIRITTEVSIEGLSDLQKQLLEAEGQLKKCDEDGVDQLGKIDYLEDEIKDMKATKRRDGMKMERLEMGMGFVFVILGGLVIGAMFVGFKFKSSSGNVRATSVERLMNEI
jgi:Leucine rich repeat